MTTRPIVASVRPVFVATSLFVIPAIAAAEDASRYSTFDQGVFLPYVNAPKAEGDIDAPPKLKISLGGKSRVVTMDTGSTGIVISAGAIPDVGTLPATPGRITYTSSGKVMVGNWVTVAVTLEGADGAKFVTKPIPVLAVSAIECLATARNCEPATDPKGVAMMGVGFGREADDQADGTPDKNPFLAAADSSKAYRRGYIVTRTGVHVGLTAANTKDGFAYTKLDPNPKIEGDWSPASVCIQINGKLPAACGNALVDTGVKGMFLTLPPAQAEGSLATTDKGAATLAAGARLTFTFPGKDPQKPVAEGAYTFVVGDDSNPLAPDFLNLNTRRPTPFVNTSVKFLNGFDYLYDADGGYVGYRWTGHAPKDVGAVTPQ